MKVLYVFVLLNFCSADGKSKGSNSRQGESVIDKIKQQANNMFQPNSIAQTSNQFPQQGSNQFPQQGSNQFPQQANNFHRNYPVNYPHNTQYQPQASNHPNQYTQYRNSASFKSTGWIVTCAICLTLTKLIF